MDHRVLESLYDIVLGEILYSTFSVIKPSFNITFNLVSELYFLKGNPCVYNNIMLCGCRNTSDPPR